MVSVHNPMCSIRVIVFLVVRRFLIVVLVQLVQYVLLAIVDFKYQSKANVNVLSGIINKDQVATHALMTAIPVTKQDIV